MKMKIKLTKIFRNPNLKGGLRTSVINGIWDEFPVIGKPFTMTAPPLEVGAFRYIRTSKIKEMNILENIITIKTESNSVYTIEVLEEMPV